MERPKPKISVDESHRYRAVSLSDVENQNLLKIPIATYESVSPVKVSHKSCILKFLVNWTILSYMRLHF